MSIITMVYNPFALSCAFACHHHGAHLRPKVVLLTDVLGTGCYSPVSFITALPHHSRWTTSPCGSLNLVTTKAPRATALPLGFGPSRISCAGCSGRHGRSRPYPVGDAGTMTALRTRCIPFHPGCDPVSQSGVGTDRDLTEPELVRFAGRDGRRRGSETDGKRSRNAPGRCIAQRFPGTVRGCLLLHPHSSCEWGRTARFGRSRPGILE